MAWLPPTGELNSTVAPMALGAPEGVQFELVLQARVVPEAVVKVLCACARHGKRQDTASTHGASRQARAEGSLQLKMRGEDVWFFMTQSASASPWLGPAMLIAR